MKKLALVYSILFSLVVTILCFQSLAKANPWVYVPYPDEPNLEVPTIKIVSPKTGEVLLRNGGRIDFTVNKPDSWNSYVGNASYGGIPEIGYYLASVYLDEVFITTFSDPYAKDFPTGSHTVIMAGLDNGMHTVRIELESITLYENPNPPSVFELALTYSKNVTETTNFTVNVNLQTPTPSPEPTPEPEPFRTGLVVSVIALTGAIVVGLLVHLKKRQRNKST